MYGNYVNRDTKLDGKYIVWGPEATQPPRMVYDTKQLAIKCAYAMASKHPGQKFCVAKLEGVAETTSVAYKELE